MAARKKTTRRKSTPARTPRRSLVKAELPPNLRQFSGRVRQGLTRLEKQVDTARRDARRRWTRLLRDASHHLGRLEAEGERRWRKQSRIARRDAARMLRRLEKAIEPPPTRRRRTTAKKSAPTSPVEARGSGI